MRKFVTLGKVGSDGPWEMVIPPDQPYDEHRSYIKGIKLAGNTHERYSEVILAPVTHECRIETTGYSREPVPFVPPKIPGVVNEPAEPFPQQQLQTPDPAPTPEPSAQQVPGPAPADGPAAEVEPDFDVTPKKAKKSK